MSLTCVTCYLTSQIIPLKTARFLEYHILLGGSRSHNLLATSADCLWILRGTSTQLSELFSSLCKQVCSPGKTCRVVAGFWHAMLSTGSNSQKAKWSSSREIYSSQQVVHIVLLQADTSLPGPESVQPCWPNWIYSLWPIIHCVNHMIRATC